MKNIKVTLYVEGGAVYPVYIPKGVTVLIQDYDIEGSGAPCCVSRRTKEHHHDSILTNMNNPK